MTDRVTRTYWWRIPRWRTRYEPGANWRLFRARDFVALFVVLLVSPVQGADWLPDVAALWYFVLFPVVLWRRVRRRRTACEQRGHQPYRPNPEAGEWVCEWCMSPLNVRDPQYVATSVAHAVSEVEAARRVSQARYSDRR